MKNIDNNFEHRTNTPRQIASYYRVSLPTFLGWMRHVISQSPYLQDKLTFYQECFYGTNGPYISRWRIKRKNISPYQLKMILSLFGKHTDFPQKYTLASLADSFGVTKKCLIDNIKFQLPDDFYYQNVPVAQKNDPLESTKPTKSSHKRRKPEKKPRNSKKMNALTPKQAEFIDKIFNGER